VFGSGLVEHEIDQSMGDTLAIVTPIALLLVVLALAFAYRDPLDILLGLLGIVTVLVWTFGLLGWLDIPFNVLLVAVPVLLIGISIDFAVHVLMRHREHRTRGDPGAPPAAIRPAMTTAIAGVGSALFWAAATTVIGFFANLVSPLSVIRQFGLASGFGIASAVLVFTTLVPALKLEGDELLESLGFDRHNRAFGTTGRLSRVLSVGGTAARRAPVVVLGVLVLFSVAAGGAALSVDTTFQQEDFIAHSPPEWTRSLPGPMAPGQYHTAEDLATVNAHFRPADAQAQLLLRGDVDTTTAFERVVAARQTAAGTPQVYTLPNGHADVEDPLSVMRTVAADNDSFNATFRDADTDGDGVPDRNVSELYDALFAADPGAASQVIHRTPEGAYAAVRLVVGVQGSASYAQTTTAMREIAATIEGGGQHSESAPTNATAAGDANLTAIATGQSVVNRVIEQALFETLTRSFVVTLVAVFLVLTIGYRLAGHGALLGAITLLPVTLSVAWILGTMALLEVPFNVLTVTITSLTIGLGVSYSIHVSARYRLELARKDDAWAALDTTLVGTGGALLGSVATTTAAFGTLALAILPVLAQFGLITAITIVYAFLASVLALPTLLILWTKYAASDASFREAPVAASTDEE
jgi:predicted RND superfamily exporter protein